MREIKFRAWDKKWKEMFTKTGDLSIDLNGGVRTGSIQLNNQVVLMQYTGLKANGAELYEGDIIEDDAEWWVIEWDNEDARYMCKPIKGGNIYIALSELAPSSSCFLQGNIYENPELINK